MQGNNYSDNWQQIKRAIKARERAWLSILPIVAQRFFIASNESPSTTQLPNEKSRILGIAS